MKPHVLIVGTVPYNKKSTSRAFEAYFAQWDKPCLAQIFSNPKTPCKGHCESLYQITDQRLVKRWFGKCKEPGKIFHYKELPDEWLDNELEAEITSAQKLYKIGRTHRPIVRIGRGVLWSKWAWRTKQLDEWLEKFQPDCVFLSFSDDYFIPEIALYVARKFNIPIVSSIGDDYFFNLESRISPFYWLYKLTYRRLIRKVLAHPGSAIYISDKIRDKYNSTFGLDGDTVYLASELQRKPFVPVNKKAPVISYFGNIGMGRNLSLNEIGTVLGRIDETYRLQVYSNAQDRELYEMLEKNPNVEFRGSIPYSEVLKKTAESDVVVVVEGFRKEDVNLSRYSLSTKAADALASGATILAYGSAECGVIEYLQSTGAAEVCTCGKELETAIRKLLASEDIQRVYYENAVRVTRENHNLERSCAVFENVVMRALEKREKHAAK